MTKTYAQLAQQIETLQQQAEGLRRKETADVVKRMKEAIAIYGLSAADLGFESSARPGRKAASATRKASNRKTRKPKFKDASGNVWSGRGPRPGWFKEALAAGKAPEDLLA